MNMVVTASPPKCDANSSGRAASDWGETWLPCQAHLGLRSLTDREGVERWFCPALGHRENVARRFGRYVSEVDTDGLTSAKARDELLAGSATFDR